MNFSKIVSEANNYQFIKEQQGELRFAILKFYEKNQQFTKRN